jgi:thiosulfate dehydrogenase [quinone] large subunit
MAMISTIEHTLEKFAWVGLRLAMGWIFLWAFLDKLFGLGFSTASERAWMSGASPTNGFLSSAPKGPFAEIFNSLAGDAFVDWSFMLALLFSGLALILNRFVRWGALAGALLMALIYLSGLPPENNPLVDEHIVYILVLLLLAVNPLSLKKPANLIS